MLKLIKIIFIVVICVGSSAATTVLLMLRYTKPIENTAVESSTASSREDHTEQQLVSSMEETVEHLGPGRERDLTDAGSVQHQPDAARYLDYALLSKDIAAISEKVDRFNKILSRKIQNLRNRPSPDENSTP